MEGPQPCRGTALPTGPGPPPASLRTELHRPPLGTAPTLPPGISPARSSSDCFPEACRERPAGACRQEAEGRHPSRSSASEPGPSFSVTRRLAGHTATGNPLSKEPGALLQAGPAGPRGPPVSCCPQELQPNTTCLGGSRSIQVGLFSSGHRATLSGQFLPILWFTF